MEPTTFNSEKLPCYGNTDDNSTSLHSNEIDIGPLHIASALGTENVLNMLLLKGAEVDETTNVGWTPLMCAARNGHLKVVQRLIECGANVHHSNKLGMSVLVSAAASGNIEVIRILLNALQDRESLQDDIIFSLLVAALYGHSNVLHLLLSSHPHLINFSDKYGITPLMLAVAGGHETAVKILLESGADPNRKNCHCFTAFDIASVMQYNSLVCLLKGRTERTEDWMSADCEPLDVGTNLIEEYGWSAVCTPQPKRNTSLNSFKRNLCREIPIKAHNCPVQLTPSSSLNVTEKNANIVFPFVTSYPHVFNDPPFVPFNAGLRNSTPINVN